MGRHSYAVEEEVSGKGVPVEGKCCSSPRRDCVGACASLPSPDLSMYRGTRIVLALHCLACICTRMCAILTACVVWPSQLAFSEHLNYCLRSDEYLTTNGYLPIDHHTNNLFTVIGDGILLWCVIARVTWRDVWCCCVVPVASACFGEFPRGNPSCLDLCRPF